MNDVRKWFPEGLEVLAIGQHWASETGNIWEVVSIRGEPRTLIGVKRVNVVEDVVYVWLPAAFDTLNRVK
jgi:hypothetical protein